MTEIRSLSDGCETRGEGVGLRHKETARLAGEAGTTLPAARRQQTKEFVATTVGTVDVPVDRFVAHAMTRRLSPQLACDLLGRPCGVQTIDDERREVRVSTELAIASAAVRGKVVSHEGEMAGDVR
jgi:hypothetical protein